MGFAPHVSISDYGAWLVEAYRSDTGELIGRAVRAVSTDPWTGWLIQIGGQPHGATLPTKATAKDRLKTVAGDVLAAAVELERAGAPGPRPAHGVEFAAASAAVWARIIAAIGDGLDTPTRVSIQPGAAVVIDLLTVDAVYAWAACLGLAVVDERVDPGLRSATATGAVAGVPVTVTAEQPTKHSTVQKGHI